MERNSAEDVPAVPSRRRRWFVIVVSSLLVGGGAFGITTGIRLLREVRMINDWFAEFESADYEVRAAALHKLGKRDIHTTSRLIELLGHSTPAVRRFAVIALQSQRSIARDTVAAFQSIENDEGQDKENSIEHLSRSGNI